MIQHPINIPTDSPFPLANIPFGIFSTVADRRHRAGTAIGNYVLDLAVLEAHGCFNFVLPPSDSVLSQATLNRFAALPSGVRRTVRATIIELLSNEHSALFQDSELNQTAFHLAGEVEMHLPMTTTEFTDFSAAEEHVRNCYAISKMEFRPENNFYYCPIGYTARCSSLVPSGTAIVRPNGVFVDKNTGLPRYQATRKLDFELEIGFYISEPVPYGSVLTPDEAEDHIFGFVLLNDWSSRDIQIYESMPAGPIHSKSFATSVSPWIVTREALEFARTPPYNQQNGQAPSHLQHHTLSDQSYDIACSASLTRSHGKSARLSASNTKHMYFTPAQLAAHRSSSRCGLVTGELIGLGTVSSPREARVDPSLARAGCLFEMTWDGTREVREVGSMYLEDGDTVQLEAWAAGAGDARIGFGFVSGTIRP